MNNLTTKAVRCRHLITASFNTNTLNKISVPTNTITQTNYQHTTIHSTILWPLEQDNNSINKPTQLETASWSSAIVQCGKNNQDSEAIRMLKQMHRMGMKPSEFAILTIINLCMKKIAIKSAQQIHTHIIICGHEQNPQIASALVDIYAKSRRVRDARQLFDEMRSLEIDVILAWDTMIARYADYNCYQEIIRLFNSMIRYSREGSKFVYVNVFASCGHLRDIVMGKQVHSFVFRVGFGDDMVVCSSIVDMYARNGEIAESRKVLDEMPEKDVVCWTSMIDGYIKYGHVDAAREVFDAMPERNSMSWNAMIAGYARQGRGHDALELFCCMNEYVDHVTLGSILSACASLMDLELGKQVHAHALRIGFGTDAFVGNAVLDMYCKCGSMENALKWFNLMRIADCVSWNSMISQCAQQGQDLVAIDMFVHMKRAGMKPSEFTYSSILKACSHSGAFGSGKQVHCCLLKAGFQSNVFIGSALVDLYSGSQNIEDAYRVFDQASNRDVVLWNSMIAGYTENKCCKEALEVFEQMIESSIMPDYRTLISVLNACSHSGLVEEGLKYFKSMSRAYNIAPRMEHYECMINLLGRAGCFDELADFITDMPFEPSSAMLKSVLENCRIHKTVELGEWAADHLAILDPDSNVASVMLADVYAEAGRLKDAANIWREIDCKE